MTADTQTAAVESRTGTVAAQHGGDPQKWLATAKFKELLSADISHKSLFVLLEQADGELGVWLLNKAAFKEDQDAIQSLISSADLREISRNDIFGNYEATVPANINPLNTQLIFPANEKIIAKYRREDKVVIRETAEDFQTITSEYIKLYAHNLTWVFNFLDKKAEAERIIFEDPDKHNGFILSPDIKWDGSNIESLYVLAIIHRRGVRSIRDLTGDDLPMLENVRDKSMAAIKEKYGLAANQVRAYFHYQPSFFHLHVHFVNLKYDAPASGTLQAVTLDDVINNLTLMGDYYQKATLSFSRKQSDKLTQMFADAGRGNIQA